MRLMTGIPEADPLARRSSPTHTWLKHAGERTPRLKLNLCYLRTVMRIVDIRTALNLYCKNAITPRSVIDGRFPDAVLFWDPRPQQMCAPASTRRFSTELHRKRTLQTKGRALPKSPKLQACTPKTRPLQSLCLLTTCTLPFRSNVGTLPHTPS